jgi:sigma-B regulation protein RsbU (phosphoserine phosphatase)
MAEDSSRVLIADDNKVNRLLLSRSVELLGHGVSLAENGRIALERLRAEPFDLLLLDIEMPELDGFAVLDQLEADPQLREVPVIVTSTVEGLDSIVRCIKLGAVDYLRKPVNQVLLKARIGASLEKKRLRDEVRASLARLEKELSQARRLQLGMLPRVFPACTSQQPVEVHAFMEPAREVGGDLYDCFYASASMFCFLVGDVSGKGAPAAMFMARTRSLVRMAVELWQRMDAAAMSSAQIAEAVNRELCQNNDDRMFVTLFLALLDTRTGSLAYTNAGHPAPHVLRASGGIESIDGKLDVPLGVRSKAAYRTAAIALLPGDAVFLVSDGVEEAMNAAGELYTRARLNAVLRNAGKASAADMVRAVTDHVHAFTGSAPLADDVTALAVRWSPTN